MDPESEVNELIETEPPQFEDGIIKFELIPEIDDEESDVDPFASEKEDSISTETDNLEDLCEEKFEESKEQEESKESDQVEHENMEQVEVEHEQRDCETLECPITADLSELTVKVYVPMISEDLFHLKVRESFTIENLFEILMENQGTTATFDSNGNFIGNVYLNRKIIDEFDCVLEEFDPEKDLIIMIHNLIKFESEDTGLLQESTNNVDCESEPVRAPSRSLMSRFKNLWSGKPTTESANIPPQTTKSFVFGKPIEELKKCPINGLPEFISDVLNYLKEPSQIQEGLFRLSGTFTKIQSLQDRIDSGELKGLKQLTSSDCHNVTSLFKQFLRNLPEPLMTFELYEGWQALGGWTEYPQVAIKIARFLVKRLPELNHLILKELMSFLHVRLKDSEVTRMNACNYGTVIGPNLLWHLKEDRNTRDSTTLGLSLQSSTLASQICTLFLQYYEEIFEYDKIEVLAYAKVLYDYNSESIEPVGETESCESEPLNSVTLVSEDQIVFITGIEDSFDGWWRGYTSNASEEGESKFPSNYVKVLRQCTDEELINQKLTI